MLSENHTTNEWVTLLSESGLFLEETVEEAYTLEEWIGMMEETGVNLNEADRKTLDSYVEKAIPSLKDLIKNHGHFNKKTLKRSKGIRRALHLIHKKDKEEMQNSAYQPSESYTLEEWMGALEEAGYNINEFLGSRYDITPNSAYERDRNAGYPTSDKVRVVGGRIVPRPPKSKKVEKSKPRNEQGNNANLGITPNGNTTSRIEKIAAHIGGLIGNPDQSKFVGYRDDNTEREKFAGRHNLPTHARREKMAQRSEQDDKLVSQKVSTIPRSISPADSSRMVANTPPGTERDAMTQRIGIQNYANQIAATKKAQGRQGGLTIRPTNPIPETVSLNENTVTRLQELAGITPVK